jgi:hypothetical protein
LDFDEFDSTIGKSQDRQLGIREFKQSAPQVEQTPYIPDKTRNGLGKLEDHYAAY